MTGTSAAPGVAAISHLEETVVGAGGAVLRYGGLYGPGATDDQVGLIRKRQFPLVGRATGYSSWVHLDDAASATVLAVEQKARGVFNIVDDEPAPAAEWLPYVAACAGAKPPMRVPVWLARLLADSLSMAALLLLERLTPLEPRSADGHIIGRAEDWEVSGATNPMSHPRLGPWLRDERGPHDGPVPGGREDGHE
ncbi:NAD-dependent epimerase/dehydratase family protein [Streptomyces sp. NPDC002596]